MNEIAVIKDIISEISPITPAYYNDKRVNGRRKAFKGYLTRNDWKRVICRINAKGISGWKLYENRSKMAGPRYSIVKHITV